MHIINAYPSNKGCSTRSSIASLSKKFIDGILETLVCFVDNSAASSNITADG